MSAILFKTVGLLTVAIIWAILQIATTSREPIRHEFYNQLKPGLVCHVTLAFIWLGTIVFAYIFHINFDLQETATDEWIFVGIFAVLILITVPTYLTKILYDEYYLCFESPFGRKVYDWCELEKVAEWGNVSGSMLMLKFSNRFWTGVSAMYEGYDELERLVYRKSFQYPRP